MQESKDRRCDEEPQGRAVESQEGAVRKRDGTFFYEVENFAKELG